MANKDKPSIPLLVLTALAAGAVTARRFVGYDGAQATAQGQVVMGVADTDAASGAYFPVVHKGTGVIESAGAIAKGAPIVASANGRALQASTGQSATVTGITEANPGVVTAEGHGFSTGDLVAFTAVGGMVEVNQAVFVVTVIDEDSFSIGVNTSGYTTYTAGGVAHRIAPDSQAAGGYIAGRALEAASAAGKFIEFSLT